VKEAWDRWGRPLSVLLMLVLAAFILACRVVATTVSAQGDSGIIGRLLVGSRRAVGQQFYEMADVYFHKGVPHHHQVGFDDFFQRLAREAAPRVHRHIHGGGVKEIMPWLRFATGADPHNVEAYLVAAFWMAGAGGRPDIALNILREAEKNNPGDYRIYAEKGRIFMILRDSRRAANVLDEALRLWPGNQSPESREARLEMGRILAYRAFLYELEGDRRNAMKMFAKASAMFPANRALRKRLEELKKGNLNRKWVLQAWQSLFPSRHVCKRGGSHMHGGHSGE